MLNVQHYTKHYFIENERIYSKACAERSRSIGGGFGNVVNPLEPGNNASFIEGNGDLGELSQAMEEQISNSITCTGVELFGLNIDAQLKGIEDLATSDNTEVLAYFTHPDHLGSSSWITDLNGDPIQHLQYLPFGEDFVNQQSTSFDTRFKFTGKEKDSETGYSYFGARYYDSDLSVWLSVDPLADKFS